MPCTANARSRIITNTPIRPPTMPSTAPAMIEFVSRGRSCAVVGEVEDLRPDRTETVQTDHRTIACSAWWYGSWSGTPTTRIRPLCRMTSTGASYRSLSTSVVSTSSGVPIRNRSLAR